jgi:hypothetical protein
VLKKYHCSTSQRFLIFAESTTPNASRRVGSLVSMRNLRARREFALDKPQNLNRKIVPRESNNAACNMRECVSQFRMDHEVGETVERSGFAVDDHQSGAVVLGDDGHAGGRIDLQ